ncbi:MAG: hypothetical protein R2784_15355 [Saprospiraceae bacterium]
MAKILIVDDEAAIRRTLREILEFEKFKVERGRRWSGMHGKTEEEVRCNYHGHKDAEDGWNGGT